VDSDSAALRQPANEQWITLDLLLRNVKTLFLCAVLAISLGAAYLAFASPTLEIAAKLLVVPDERLLDQEQRKRESDAFLPTQAEIIRSPAVIQRALETMASPANEPATYEVIGRLQVQPLLGTNVMTLRLQDTNEASGLKLLSAIIASYKNYL